MNLLRTGKNLLLTPTTGIAEGQYLHPRNPTMSVPMIKSKFEIPNQETFSPEPISPENILFVIPRNVEIGRVLFAVTLFKLNNVVNHFNICKLFAIII